MTKNVTMATSSGSDSNSSFHDSGLTTISASTELSLTNFGNHSQSESDHPMSGGGSDLDLSSGVIVAIAVGSAVVLIAVVAVLVYYIRKKYHKKKSKAWVDNLTLSYIADSNIDLTKDNYDEMISLDNDNFLNSLTDTNAFSVWRPDSNAKQYTYSYF